MTPLARLTEQAAQFAERLTELLIKTVTVDTAVTSSVIEEKSIAFVAPGALEDAPGPPLRPIVPLSLAQSEAERMAAPLWLRLSYRLTMDQEGQYAAVASSSFGLCIDPKTMRQAIRIEFDRQKTVRPAAHVQVHGVSAEFAYAYAVTGSQPKPLEKLHIPVGGLRYRPSLEDFIEFLKSEGFLTGVHKGWKQTLDASRQEYERRQLKAAIRRDPKTAGEGLEHLGYRVEPPN